MEMLKTPTSQNRFHVKIVESFSTSTYLHLLMSVVKSQFMINLCVHVLYIPKQYEIDVVPYGIKSFTALERSQPFSYTTNDAIFISYSALYSSFKWFTQPVFQRCSIHFNGRKNCLYVRWFCNQVYTKSSRQYLFWIVWTKRYRMMVQCQQF